MGKENDERLLTIEISDPKNGFAALAAPSSKTWRDMKSRRRLLSDDACAPVRERCRLRSSQTSAVELV